MQHKFDNIEYWTDSQGRYHRNRGPALIFECSLYWYKHGTLHREDGPAIITQAGKGFYLNGELLTPEQFFEQLPKSKKMKFLFNFLGE